MDEELNKSTKIHLEYIQETKKLKQVIKDTRKFMNRLPSEWYPEHLCALLDDCLEEEEYEQETI